MKLKQIKIINQPRATYHPFCPIDRILTIGEDRLCPIASWLKYKPFMKRKLRLTRPNNSMLYCDYHTAIGPSSIGKWAICLELFFQSVASFHVRVRILMNAFLSKYLNQASIKYSTLYSSLSNREYRVEYGKIEGCTMRYGNIERNKINSNPNDMARNQATKRNHNSSSQFLIDEATEALKRLVHQPTTVCRLRCTSGALRPNMPLAYCGILNVKGENMKNVIMVSIVLFTLNNMFAETASIPNITVKKVWTEYTPKARVVFIASNGAPYEFPFNEQDPIQRHRASMILSILLTAKTTTAEIEVFRDDAPAINEIISVTLGKE